MGKVLEVCVDSVASARAAKAGGATRLELCANLIIGGTTPSVALFDAVQEQTGLPVHVLIRPRFGDFLYTDDEYRIMCREIELFRARGAAAVVIGALKPDGRLDTEKLHAMVDASAGCKVTLHRAFDVCRDAFEAMDEAFSLGVCTILTSGQRATAWEGRALLGELLSRAKGEILIGGGVNAEVIAKLRARMPAEAFHLSGKKTLPSAMVWRNEDVSMGLGGISEYQIFTTDEAAIRLAHTALFG